MIRHGQRCGDQWSYSSFRQQWPSTAFQLVKGTWWWWRESFFESKLNVIWPLPLNIWRRWRKRQRISSSSGHHSCYYIVSPVKRQQRCHAKMWRERAQTQTKETPYSILCPSADVLFLLRSLRFTSSDGPTTHRPHKRTTLWPPNEPTNERTVSHRTWLLLLLTIISS